jgi:hypothetical protein
VQVDPENPNTLVHSCDTAMGAAFVPLRLVELAYSFGEDGLVASSCREDWTPALQALARMIQDRIGTGCVQLPDAVDPATDCRLVEVLDDGSELEVPRADDDAGGWALDLGSPACAGGGQLLLEGEPLRAARHRFECWIEQ